MHKALTLLLRHTDRPSPTARSLGMLTSDPQTPIMPQTSMGPDLLQSLQILTQFAIDTVGKDLTIFAINDITLTIEEPRRNFILGWILNDGHDSLQFFGCEFTGTT